MSDAADPRSALLEPQERVLTTLNRDGSRRWLRPRVSPGRFLVMRRWVGYVLIAIFVAIPHLYLNGKPLILLNIPARQFTFFGYTFLPTDTLLLALFMVGLIVGIFLLTALLGRIWCGWVCPQTVYLELVYRPIEYFFDGSPGRGGRRGKSSSAVRQIVKYAIYLVISAILANTFLAYFVGAERLQQWVLQSPWRHPTPFVIMAVTTGLMLFNFAYFREQTCIVACPYGRFQSVMLDRDSLIISYDPKRGEPRGPLRRSSSEPEAPRGDCIDCGLCVETCPTGIDIRKGLQMECVGCAQCIDACDAVMDKVSRPRGLIRYSSQRRIEDGASRVLRPRLFIYPAVLLAVGAAFGVLLIGKPAADVSLLRGMGAPFALLPGGDVSNQLKIKIANRTDAAVDYTIRVTSPSDARLLIDQNPLRVDPGAPRVDVASVVLPRGAFNDGAAMVALEVVGSDGFRQTQAWRALGPKTSAAPP